MCYIIHSQMLGIRVFLFSSPYQLTNMCRKTSLWQLLSLNIMGFFIFIYIHIGIYTGLECLDQNNLHGTYPKPHTSTRRNQVNRNNTCPKIQMANCLGCIWGDTNEDDIGNTCLCGCTEDKISNMICWGSFQFSLQYTDWSDRSRDVLLFNESPQSQTNVMLW